MGKWHISVAATLAAASLAVAGCGGGGSPSNGVASLSGSGKDPRSSSTTTLPKGTPTQLLDEWATCMRAHGDPAQADPTIDANGVIHITLPSGVDPGMGRNNPCQSYLAAASTALGGNAAPHKPDPAKLLKFAKCMRSRGVHDFPDPSGGGLQLRATPGSDLDPANPTFKAASQYCAKKYDLPGLGGTPQKGAISMQSTGGPGGGSSGMLKPIGG